jgi:hypothetical protein
MIRLVPWVSETLTTPTLVSDHPGLQLYRLGLAIGEANISTKRFVS